MEPPAARGVAGSRRYAEILEDIGDHLISGLGRPKQEHRVGLVFPALEQMVEQGGFSHAGASDQDQKSPALEKPVMERRQGFGGLCAPIEKARVRGGPERLFRTT